MSRPVVILRPEPGNSETRSRLEALGLTAIAMPLFAVEPVAWDPPDPAAFTAVMMTSANAARVGGRSLEMYRHLPLFAVGHATEAAAKEAGFVSVTAGESGVAHLLATFATLGPQKILHLCGEDSINTNTAGLQIDRRIIYRSRATNVPLEQNFATLAHPIVLVHSPRAGRKFAQLCDANVVPRSTSTIVAISEAAALAAGWGWEKLAIAANPRDEAMVEIAQSLAQTGWMI
jgi:uroporphyrinogen-III synthase